MMRIVHLTDLHFGADDPAVVAALRADINANPPDLVAVSGDLTQGARHTEFRAARDFIASLAAPALVVPGNHDITPYDLAERFFDPYRRWRAEIGPQTEPEWRNNRLIAVGLNTARRAGMHPDWSRGRVTRRRLARVLARLDAAPPGLVRVVVAHHPLLPPENSPLTTVAGGAARALAAFARHNVRLVLAGHLHRSYSRMAPDFGPGLVHPAPDAAQGAAAPPGAPPGAKMGAAMPLILQGGSATSTRLRGEPNAYGIVRIADDGGIAVERRIWHEGQWLPA